MPSKCDLKKRVRDYAYAVVELEGNGGGVDRGFDVLLELLDVHPQLPGGAPLTVTSRCWKVSIRTEAVTALWLMVVCSGR